MDGELTDLQCASQITLEDATFWVLRVANGFGPGELPVGGVQLCIDALHGLQIAVMPLDSALQLLQTALLLPRQTPLLRE
jgi:hypothetical protein